MPSHQNFGRNKFPTNSTNIEKERGLKKGDKSRLQKGPTSRSPVKGALSLFLLISLLSNLLHHVGWLSISSQINIVWRLKETQLQADAADAKPNSSEIIRGLERKERMSKGLKEKKQRRLVARTLLGAPGTATSSKDATRNKK